MHVVYVALLDEGTEVFRPVEGEFLSDGWFRLVQTVDYDPDDEKWEFLPGSVVRVMNRNLDSETVLIAIGSDDDPKRKHCSISRRDTNKVEDFRKGG